LILNGKLVKDDDTINGLKIKNATIMQAFITQPANTSTNPDLSDAPSDSKIDPISFTDALGGYRGFDFFKANGYTVIHFYPIKS
jgi:hypothetical protein